MTGMDVLRRVRAYDTDMARLRLRLACARDAATRITRSTDTTGHGGMVDKMGEHAAKVDQIEREMAARRAVYERDVLEAARLIGEMEPLQGRVMHLRMMRGMTVRQTAGEMKTSEGSVKGLFRRGREALESVRIPQRGCDE